MRHQRARRTRASMGFLEQVEAYGYRVVVRPQDEFGLLEVATGTLPRPFPVHRRPVQNAS